MFCNYCRATNPDDGSYCSKCGRPLSNTDKQHDFDSVPTELGLLPGSVLLSRYQITKELGIGGMGRVYLADDQKLEMLVAIKVLRETLSRDTGSVKRLVAEAKHSMALSHSNIVRVHNFEDAETAKFLVMEYVEGETLADRIAEKRKLSEEETRLIAIEICKGLEHAHQKKVIHRDIKPGNILLGKNGEIKIADFGIARECRDSMSRLTSQIDSGTLLYMSPEQLLGKSNEASDIYSLGVVIYEMLTGEPPFRSGDIPYQIREVMPPSPEGISPGMTAIMMKCLEKKPENRFASAHKLIEELDRTAERRRIEARQRIEEEKKRQAQEAARQREEEQQLKRADAKAKADALAARASALLESNRYEDAGSLLQEALELDPSNEAARQAMNRCRIARREAAQPQITGPQISAPPQVFETPQRGARKAVITLILIALFFGSWYAINRMSREPDPTTTSNPDSNAQPPVDNSEQVRQLLIRARQAYESGDFSGSIMAYDDALAIDTSNQEAISGKANAQKARNAEQAKAKTAPSASPSPVDLALKAELSLWETIKGSDDTAVFHDYLHRYPSGQFVEAARSRIRSLDVARIKQEIRTQMEMRNWDAAERSINELLKISSNDAHATNWRKQIATEIESERKAAEAAGLKKQVRNYINGRDWQNAGEKVNELLRLAPNDEEGLVWRKQINQEIESERQARERAATVNRIDMEFVTIPAGKFMMGCSQGDSQCFSQENPRHEVIITRSFQMSKYEVTQDQWQKSMGNNPSYFKGDDRLPVEQVSWDDAQGFIAKLNGLNDGYRYRLPTEAEWEYAARAGTTGPYYGNLDAIGWNNSNSGSKTHPVGQKQANGFGLYDMIGNVWEWCSDWYGEGYYGSSPSADPKGPSSGRSRILRGGSRFSSARDTRVYNRYGGAADGRNDTIGLRLCRERF